MSRKRSFWSAFVTELSFPSKNVSRNWAGNYRPSRRIGAHATTCASLASPTTSDDRFKSSSTLIASDSKFAEVELLRGRFGGLQLSIGVSICLLLFSTFKKNDDTIARSIISSFKKCSGNMRVLQLRLCATTSGANPLVVLRATWVNR